MKKLKGKLFEIVAVAFCLLVLCGFVSMKQGFHMDELLSFELSNAEFNPWIVPTQPEGRLAKFVHNEIDGETLGETLGNLAAEVKDVLKNRGNSKLLTYQADVYEEPVWITAEQFRDYIQVEAGDAFHYLSVYFNVKDDNHPPLHFMLLHTVSSLFRGRAEAWMGCLINLAAVAGILTLLIKSGRLLGAELGLQGTARTVGVLAALLYGLSAGAVATVLLIRMYGLVTLWCAAYFWLVLKKWRDRGFEKHNVGLILVTALGFWTQYFFLFYCILLAGTVCVLLLKDGRKKELGCFIRSMVIAGAVGLAAFPFALSDVFSSGRGVEAMENFSRGLSGYGSRLSAFLGIVSERTSLSLLLAALLAAAVLTLVFALLKKRRLQQKGVIAVLDREAGRTAGRGAYLWMLLLPPVGYFLLAARMSPYLVDRYVMPVFPFVALTAALALGGFLEKGFRGRYEKGAAAALLGVTVLVQAWGLSGYDGSYLYRGYDIQEAAAKDNAGYACICVYEGVGYYENLKEFTWYEKTLLVTPEELAGRQDRESIEALDRVAVLVKCDEVDVNRVQEIMEETYGFSLERWGWQGTGVHGDMLLFMSRTGD